MNYIHLSRFINHVLATVCGYEGPATLSTPHIHLVTCPNCKPTPKE